MASSERRSLFFHQHGLRLYRLFSGGVDRFHHDGVAADLVEAHQLLEVAVRFHVYLLVVDEDRRAGVRHPFDHVERSADGIRPLELERGWWGLLVDGPRLLLPAADPETPEPGGWADVAVRPHRGHPP